jgi:hypothetical protein
MKILFSITGKMVEAQHAIFLGKLYPLPHSLQLLFFIEDSGEILLLLLL